LLRGRDVDEIKELKRGGLSIKAIGRLTSCNRKTISQYLLASTGRLVYRPIPSATSNVEPFKSYLKERLRSCVWNAQVLFRELRERNYGGGYSTLTEWLRLQRVDLRRCLAAGPG
jgi:transposase